MSREEMSDEVTRIREARDRADDVLKNMIRPNARSVFLGLNGRIQNEARDLQAFIEAVYGSCDAQSRGQLRTYKREIEEILQERQDTGLGALADEDTEVDTPDAHIDRITDFTRRIDRLCPQVLNLDRIWQRLNALYEDIRVVDASR